MIGKPFQDRIGRVRIPIDWLASRPAEVVAALEGCMIVRAECMISFHGIVYEIAHPSLDLVQPGYIMPDYDIEMRGGVRDRFVRRPLGL